MLRMTSMNPNSQPSHNRPSSLLFDLSIEDSNPRSSFRAVISCDSINSPEVAFRIPGNQPFQLQLQLRNVLSEVRVRIYPEGSVLPVQTFVFAVLDAATAVPGTATVKTASFGDSGKITARLVAHEDTAERPPDRKIPPAVPDPGRGEKASEVNKKAQSVAEAPQNETEPQPAARVAAGEPDEPADPSTVQTSSEKKPLPVEQPPQLYYDHNMVADFANYLELEFYDSERHRCLEEAQALDRQIELLDKSDESELTLTDVIDSVAFGIDVKGNLCKEDQNRAALNKNYRTLDNFKPIHECVRRGLRSLLVMLVRTGQVDLDGLDLRGMTVAQTAVDVADFAVAHYVNLVRLLACAHLHPAAYRRLEHRYFSVWTDRLGELAAAQVDLPVQTVPRVMEDEITRIETILNADASVRLRCDCDALREWRRVVD